MNQVFFRWLPLAIATTILTGLIYVSVQQDYRSTANDPQIQLVHDAVAALQTSAPAASVLNGFAHVDLLTSLAPFVEVYDEKGAVLAGNGYLGQNIPQPPQGVFDNARTLTESKGDHRLTWQPQAGVRIAAVIVHYQSGNESGFVLAGRSLREVEKRVNGLTLATAIAYVLTLLATFAAVATFRKSA